MSSPGQTGTAYLSLQSRHSNFGDYLLLYALICRLTEARRLVVRVKDVPQDFVDGLLSESHNNIKRVDGLLLGRAILAALRSRLTPGYRSRIELWFKPGHASLSTTSVRHFVRGLALRLLRKLGGRAIRLGVSISPTLPDSLTGERFLLRTFYTYGCRDQDSKTVLERLGIGGTIVTPDFIFSPQIRELVSTNPRPSENSPLASSLNVGISFRNPDLIMPPSTGGGDALSHLVCSLVEHFSSDRVTHVWVMGQTRGDADFSSTLVPNCPGAELSITSSVSSFVPGRDSFGELSRWYSSQDLVLTNRLHVWLLALMHAIPSIALIEPMRQVKIASYAKELGLSHLVFDQRREGLDQMLERIHELMEGDELSGLQERFECQTVRLERLLDSLLA